MKKKTKLLLVGGNVEGNEMQKISEALAETGYVAETFEFLDASHGQVNLQRIAAKIAQFKPDMVFPRVHFYPRHEKATKRIGTNYITEHMLNLGLPVVGSSPDTLRILRSKAETDTRIHDASSDFANDFILFDGNAVGGTSYGEILSMRGFSKNQIKNPFLKYPVLFIKPNGLGRSAGITDKNVLRNMQELEERAAELAAEFPREKLLLNPFYNGREFTVGVVGNANRIVLPIEVCQQEGYSINKILPTNVKRGGIPTGKVFVRVIEDSSLVEKLKANAASIADILGVQDYTRADFRLDGKNQLHEIDVNGIPGLKKMESYIAMAAEYAFQGQEAGYSIYSRLVSTIVQAAAERFGISSESYPTLFELKLNKGKN